MTIQSENDWKSMTCLKGLPAESLGLVWKVVSEHTARPLEQCTLDRWDEIKDHYAQHGHLTPAVKHGGGGVMILTCFAAIVPGHLPVNKSIMNSSVWQNIPAISSSYCCQRWFYKLPNHGRSLVFHRAAEIPLKTFLHFDFTLASNVQMQKSILVCCFPQIQFMCISHFWKQC